MEQQPLPSALIEKEKELVFDRMYKCLALMNYTTQVFDVLSSEFLNLEILREHAAIKEQFDKGDRKTKRGLAKQIQKKLEAATKLNARYLITSKELISSIKVKEDNEELIKQIILDIDKLLATQRFFFKNPNEQQINLNQL